jgi:hypothetical protein
MDEMVAYYGQAVDQLQERGWTRQQAHSIALDAGANRFGPQFVDVVVQEGLFGRGKKAAGSVHGAFAEMEHPRGRGGEWIEKAGGHVTPHPEPHAHPIGPELPKVTDKAKGIMGTVAKYAREFGADGALADRFASGDIQPNDIRRMREQIMRALDAHKALSDVEKRDEGHRRKHDTASTASNALRALERELGLHVAGSGAGPIGTKEVIVDGKKLRVSADFGTERWRHRQVSVERSIADPFGHYAYRENG